MSLPAGNGLVGSFYVTPTATAIRRAWKLCKRSARDYQILRRHALKLAYFPACGDWDWVKSLHGKCIGELRIDERIASQENIRVIFFQTKIQLPSEPLPRIWTLTVFPKKSDNFTAREINAFKAMREIIVIRTYGGSQSV